MTSAPAGTQSIVRAVRLLKAVAESEEPVSLAELAVTLGISKPTVHRILGALEAENLVARHRGGFRPGGGVITMGAQALASSNLRSMARLHLERLAAESGETATLEVPSGDHMLILDEVRGGQVVGAVIEVGTRWPMHATSTGKAFLGALDDAELLRRLQGSRRRVTPNTLTSGTDLRAAASAAAERGYAVTEEELELGYSAVAAAVLTAGGPVGALSVGGPSDRVCGPALERFGTLVAAAARELSEAQGAS